MTRNINHHMWYFDNTLFLELFLLWFMFLHFITGFCSFLFDVVLKILKVLVLTFISYLPVLHTWKGKGYWKQNNCLNHPKQCSRICLAYVCEKNMFCFLFSASVFGFLTEDVFVNLCFQHGKVWHQFQTLS